MNSKLLKIEKGTDSQNSPGSWVTFVPVQAPVFVARHHWVGVDFDGTLSYNKICHPAPPYPLGEPNSEMVQLIKTLLAAGVTVKIFTARACETANIPAIQDWTECKRVGSP